LREAKQVSHQKQTGKLPPFLKTHNLFQIDCLFTQLILGTSEMVSSRSLLFGSVLITSAIIVSVHYMQSYEKSVMHKGVLRDIERQKTKAKKSITAVGGGNENKESSPR
jgi:hypothetical protein